MGFRTIMKTPTDEQLKQTLVKMLPEQVLYVDDENCEQLFWKPQDKDKLREAWLDGLLIPIGDTELLHLCWLVEETLEDNSKYVYALWDSNRANRKQGFSGEWLIVHSTWQQRVIALAKVKGIDIV